MAIFKFEPPDNTGNDQNSTRTKNGQNYQISQCHQIWTCIFPKIADSGVFDHFWQKTYLNHLETLFPQFHWKHGKAVIFGWISNQDITSNFPKNLEKSKLRISNDEFPWKGVEFHIQLGKMHHLDAKGTKGELVLEFKMSQSFDCPHKSSMYVHCKQNCYF